MLEGAWRRLADQVAQCTPVMRLAMQGAALHGREAPPARELWVCTRQTMWVPNAGAKHPVVSTLSKNVRAKRTSLGIRRQALSGELISSIRPTETGRRKKAGNF